MGHIFCCFMENFKTEAADRSIQNLTHDVAYRTNECHYLNLYLMCSTVLLSSISDVIVKCIQIIHLDPLQRKNFSWTCSLTTFLHHWDWLVFPSLILFPLWCFQGLWEKWKLLKNCNKKQSLWVRFAEDLDSDEKYLVIKNVRFAFCQNTRYY